MFGSKGRDRVMKDMHRLWDHYKEIVSKQHHLRTELDKLYKIEQREAELQKHLHNLRNAKDLTKIAHEAQRIIKEELHYVVLIEKNVDRCIRHLKDQKSLIKRIRKDLRG